MPNIKQVGLRIATYIASGDLPWVPIPSWVETPSIHLASYLENVKKVNEKYRFSVLVDIEPVGRINPQHFPVSDTMMLANQFSALRNFVRELHSLNRKYGVQNELTFYLSLWFDKKGTQFYLSPVNSLLFNEMVQSAQFFNVKRIGIDHSAPNRMDGSITGTNNREMFMRWRDNFLKKKIQLGMEAMPVNNLSNPLRDDIGNGETLLSIPQLILIDYLETISTNGSPDAWGAIKDLKKDINVWTPNGPWKEEYSKRCKNALDVLGIGSWLTAQAEDHLIPVCDVTAQNSIDAKAPVL